MNILLTSAGRRTYMVNYFKEALKGKGLVYASNNTLTHTLKVADRHVISPSIYDNDYIDFLVDYCKTHGISAVISLFDIDLPILSKNRHVFEKEGIKLIVSNEEAISICNDKWKTKLFLDSISIKHPGTYISLSEVKQLISENKISFPLFLKPRWGMGSIGLFEVDNIDELEVFYKKLHKIIFSSYLKHESTQDIENSIIIQEKIQGYEYGLDILNDLNGNYVATVAKRKIALRAGETDIAQIVDNYAFNNISLNISKSLKHIANLDVDCFVTSSGEIFVLEMNCRFGGQYPFSHIAGVNYPLQIIKWINGDTENDPNLLRAKTGIMGCKEIDLAIL